MATKGTINVQTENIFPLIKKFLYSDHEIFLRELISNAVDSTSKLKVLSPFGPKIAKLKFPKTIVLKINDEVDKIIKKKRLGKNDYSKKLVGEVSQEIQLSKSFIDKNIKSFISKKISEYLKIIKKKELKKIIIKNFWIVRQFKNEYNPVHYHDGNISGVGYLKIPINIYKSKKHWTYPATRTLRGSRFFFKEIDLIFMKEQG